MTDILTIIYISQLYTLQPKTAAQLPNEAYFTKN